MSSGIPCVDAVFVVSLHARPDRLFMLDRELSAQGIRYETFDAFDGPALGLRTDAASRQLVSPANPSGLIPPGRLGAYLSKVALFRECRRRGLGDVLILEDDAAVAPDFGERLSDAVASVAPGSWDAIYCGCWDWHSTAARPVNRHLYRPGRAMLLHAVLYAAHAFDALVEETRTLRDTMDVQLSGRLNPRLDVLATVDPIARQRTPNDSHGS